MNIIAATGTLLVNRIYDELSVGETVSLVRLVKPDDIKIFAAMSGDVNPAHLDAQYAAKDIFDHVVAYGMWTGALISTLLGTELPGPGTIYLSQDLHFRKPLPRATPSPRPSRFRKSALICHRHSAGGGFRV